jgi:hypothetical protein
MPMPMPIPMLMPLPMPLRCVRAAAGVASIILRCGVIETAVPRGGRPDMAAGDGATRCKGQRPT